MAWLLWGTSGKNDKIPFKTTQAEIQNISSVWVLHDKMKKLDFSGGFLSVIRNLVGVLFQNTPLRVLQPNPKRSPQATKPPSLSLLKTNFNPLFNN
ncbi:hypothetical protein HPHPP30_0629 [Helicobacter pylori Hp P-30]|nr:hypothetical protein HPHPP30_0629 [Helicobacter pylori Hp P-30]